MNNKRTASEQRVNTIEEGNNGRRKEWQNSRRKETWKIFPKIVFRLLHCSYDADNIRADEAVTQTQGTQTMMTRNEALAMQIETLGWMIDDAKRDLAKAAEYMSRRAAEAISQTQAMLADKPCSMSWVDFAESDLRHARQAEATLTKLVEQQKILLYIAGKAE